MGAVKTLSNLDIGEKEGVCVISINPRIYPLEVIYSAAYIFIDKAYVLIDGDLKKSIKVELKPKESYDPERLGEEFNNELLNYLQYSIQSKKTAKIRQILLQRVLLTNDPTSLLQTSKRSYSNDPKGITIPWKGKGKGK